MLARYLRRYVCCAQEREQSCTNNLCAISSGGIFDSFVLTGMLPSSLWKSRLYERVCSACRTFGGLLVPFDRKFTHCSISGRSGRLAFSPRARSREILCVRTRCCEVKKHQLSALDFSSPSPFHIARNQRQIAMTQEIAAHPTGFFDLPLELRQMVYEHLYRYRAFRTVQPEYQEGTLRNLCESDPRIKDEILDWQDVLSSVPP